MGKKGILTKSEIVKTAKLFLESPYLWGGRITSGIDCSGFSQLIYRICGLEIERDARQQALQGKKIDSSKINPGNLAFFGNSIKEITHVIDEGVVEEYKKKDESEWPRVSMATYCHDCRDIVPAGIGKTLRGNPRTVCGNCHSKKISMGREDALRNFYHIRKQEEDK